MDTLALILSIIGAINWGLVGICQFDLVAWLFGGQTGIVSRIIIRWWVWPDFGASVCCSGGKIVSALRIDPQYFAL